jgi:hypothetical protein
MVRKRLSYFAPGGKDRLKVRLIPGKAAKRWREAPTPLPLSPFAYGIRRNTTQDEYKSCGLSYQNKG